LTQFVFPVLGLEVQAIVVAVAQEMEHGGPPAPTLGQREFPSQLLQRRRRYSPQPDGQPGAADHVLEMHQLLRQIQRPQQIDRIGT